MIVAASLLAYATLVAFLGQTVLTRLTRTGSAPRLGILAWYLAAVSAVASWMVGALAIADPDPLHGLAHLITAGLTAVHEVTGVHDVTAAPEASWLRTAGAAAAAAILSRAGFCVVRDSWGGHRRRRRHARTLELVARPLAGRDAVVVEHSTAMVYCLPGRSRTIVITQGALLALSGPQLDAVLEHEHAHLAGRHHLVLTPLRALARAFPGIPLLARAARDVSRLLEMYADDAAARRHGGATVAGALRSLSAVATPRETFAAAGSSAEERIARLCDTERGRPTSGGLMTAVVLLATGPLVSVTVPILLAASSAR